MSIIGLTGPTGAGKSTVSKAAKKIGFFVVNCDEVARQTRQNPQVREALVGAFGEGILSCGELDRKALAAAAFSSRENTEKLNKTILPFIVSDIKKLIAGKKNVLLDAPTLFESGIDNICDKTIGVLCDEEIRKKRIIARDNLSEAEAKARLSAAKSDEFFKERCSVIIENDGSEQELLIKAEKILSEYITEE